MILGIDATNIRTGGGLTHLVQFLEHADPARSGFLQVVIWASPDTLAALPCRDWLRKESTSVTKFTALSHFVWQTLLVSKAARSHGVSVLFIPGGTYVGGVRPAVVMCRNMLPFDWNELFRYRISRTTARLILLRFLHSRSFRRADGVVFLSRYAKSTVEAALKGPPRLSTIVPHGLSEDFKLKPRKHNPLEHYSWANPMRVVYVSVIDTYKHQWNVATAVAALRQRGMPLSLDLVGPAYPPSMRRLSSVMRRLDPEQNWLRYWGKADQDEILNYYHQADIGVFASSCENLPNIVLELMGAALPIASSNRGPMPEVLGAGAEYFDPEETQSIEVALQRLVASSKRRSSLSRRNARAAANYAWDRAAHDTLEFLAVVAVQGRRT